MGRYLEHGRIYSFFDGVHTRIYIASGDFLTRNTECRVEVGVRIEDPVLVKKLTDILQMQLHDNVNAREMRSDGSYQKVKPAEGEPLVNSQMDMYDLLKNDWTAADPWKPTTPNTEPSADSGELAVDGRKAEQPHAPQPKEPAAETAPNEADHYDALEQMLNNKPHPAQPAPKAAPARLDARPAVTETESKPQGLLNRIRSWLHR